MGSITSIAVEDRVSVVVVDFLVAAAVVVASVVVVVVVAAAAKTAVDIGTVVAAFQSLPETR